MYVYKSLSNQLVDRLLGSTPTTRGQMLNIQDQASSCLGQACGDWAKIDYSASSEGSQIAGGCRAGRVISRCTNLCTGSLLYIYKSCINSSLTVKEMNAKKDCVKMLTHLVAEPELESSSPALFV